MSDARAAIETWRPLWLALVAEPDRDDLAQTLARQVRLDQEQARTQPPGPEAVGRLLRNLFILHHLARNRSPFEPGPYWREILGNLGAPSRAQSEDEDEDEVEVEDHDDVAEDDPPLDPTKPFFAWELAERAVEAPPAERSALVDRALDAFESIIGSPRDPGSDCGPMCDLAAVMDATQVRRAWTIERRMAAAGWLSPNWTAPYLVSRLAALGEWSEAQARLAEIVDAGGRALALGRVAAHAVLADRAPPLFGPEQRHWLAGEGLVELIRGLTLVLSWPESPPPSLVPACLELVRSHPDARARSGALVLLEVWYGVGPTQDWRRAIEACAVGESRVHALFTLAEEARDTDDVAEVVRAAMLRLFALPQRRATRWLGEFGTTLKALPRDEAWQAFARMIVSAGHDGSWPLADLSRTDLVDVLRWLAGEDAPATVAEHLRDVERCLGG